MSITFPSHVIAIRDFLRPHVEANRHMAVELIAPIPTDVLAIRPGSRRAAAPA